MITYIPLIICLAGLIVYLASKNSKVTETGRIMFFCGLLVVLLHVGSVLK